LSIAQLLLPLLSFEEEDAATLVSLASQHGQLAVLQWLLNHFDWFSFDSNCPYIFPIACEKGHLNVVKLLLQDYRFSETANCNDCNWLALNKANIYMNVIYKPVCTR
jgi:hypothetical protein